MSEWIKKLTEAYSQQQEAMDPVDKSELKGKHKDRKDKDIDNDGDVDSSDEYLHKKRKAISKAQKNEAVADLTEMEDHGRFVFDMKSKEHMNAAKKDLKAAGMSSRNRPGHTGGDHALHVKGSAKAIHKVMKKHANNMHDANMGSHHDMNDDTYGHRLMSESIEDIYENDAYYAAQDARKHAARDGHDYDRNTDVAQRYGAYHMKKRGYTHFTSGRYGSRTYHKHDMPDATKIGPEHHRGVRESVKQVDEISMSKLGKYAKAAKKDIDQKRNTVKLALDQPASVKNAKAGMKAMAGLTKRSRGSDMYVNKMTGRSKVKPSMEAYEGVPKATHKGYQDPQGVGLAPSAKDQLSKKTPMPEPVDEPKVDAKNFKDFRKSLKVSKKRPGDNDKGDKNIVK